MKQFHSGIILALLSLLSRSLSAQNTDVEEQLKPSVVAIRNDEGFGTGMFLDEQGLILTNAHVACSPLPYRVQAWAKVGNAYKDVTFRKVQLLGFHPTYDLALLQIDPSECDAKVQPVKLAANPPSSRERVWAMGFPQDYNLGNIKVTTWGEVKSARFDFFGENYYELDISINHGNSGGPACNGKGEVIGVVAMMTKESALAVPISAFKPDRFSSLRDRVPNREISSDLIERAEKLSPQGRGGLPPMSAMMLYEMALLWDSGNAALYSKVGQLNLKCGRAPAAVAYLIRSVRMEPWSESPETYRSLGLALAGISKFEDAVSILDEGLRKYPADNGQLWGEFSVVLERTQQYYLSCVSARISLKTFVSDSAPVNAVYKRSVEKLNPDELSKLRELESDIDGYLRRLRATSEKARLDSKGFLTPEAEKVVATYDGTQKETGVGRPTSDPKPLNISDEELAIRFIRNRIDVAKEHVRIGLNQKAIDILEDIILSYPKHPETDSARLLLKFLKK
jgi:tetratricopeptide (TPR) repeat protein